MRTCVLSKDADAVILFPACKWMDFSVRNYNFSENSCWPFCYTPPSHPSKGRLALPGMDLLIFPQTSLELFPHIRESETSISSVVHRGDSWRFCLQSCSNHNFCLLWKPLRAAPYPTGTTVSLYCFSMLILSLTPGELQFYLTSATDGASSVYQ